MQHPEKNVTLKPFYIYRDLPIISAWLKLPHVQRWWGEPEKNLEMITDHSQSMQAMIQAGLISVGYVCWQHPSKQELIDAGLTDLPQGLIDIDIMIGEPDFLGHGFGTKALSLLLEKLHKDEIEYAGIGTSSFNGRALRAYEKAGFKRFRVFHENNEDYYYLIKDFKSVI